jgi:hypothetical protein
VLSDRGLLPESNPECPIAPSGIVRYPWDLQLPNCPSNRQQYSPANALRGSARRDVHWATKAFWGLGLRRTLHELGFWGLGFCRTLHEAGATATSFQSISPARDRQKDRR